jgi:hypothetical protein
MDEMAKVMENKKYQPKIVGLATWHTNHHQAAEWKTLIKAT